MIYLLPIYAVILSTKAGIRESMCKLVKEIKIPVDRDFNINDNVYSITPTMMNIERDKSIH